MFILAQLIGLYVVNFYMDENNKLPYGFDENQAIQKDNSFYTQFLISLVFSFVVAIAIVFFLIKVKSNYIIKIWFFGVTCIALGITLTIASKKLGIIYPSYIALAVGVVLAYFKIFRRNIIIHNITELLIYPGIAALFVLMLNLPTCIILLILISIYDIWAVWKSGIMQKMASFQINNVGVFGGFFLPYAGRKMKEKINLLKEKYNNKIPMKIAKKHGLKINLAILGGGDIIFPIIAAGVFLKTFSSIYASLIVILFATLGLLYIFLFGKKKKPYPAMPYLTAGLLIGMAVARLLLVYL
jgi:presenilin-like A22 family membrane protease